jgi:hypothetical protein
MSPKVHNLRRHFCFVFFVLFIGTSCCSQETLLTTNKNNFYRHGVELSPLSPVMNIYGVLYSYGITKKDWLVAGPVYMRIKYDFGNTDAWALIVGYRRYLWRNLHLEYQLYPTYDDFFESRENKIYSSFDVWNEFRLGYKVDFRIKKAPLYLNVQWPFGFGLFASNKPQSFKEAEKLNRFFYFPPMIFAGFRF